MIVTRRCGSRVPAATCMFFRTCALLIFYLWRPEGASAASPPSTSQQNNLLVILTDQQRFDTLRFVQEERGVPERAWIRTPNLDRIAREGAYFRNAYTHCAVCGPARAGFMFGCTIENTGIRTNNMAKDENLPGSDAEYKLPNLLTYDEILVNEYGYAAEYYGKWHLPNSKGLIYNNDVRRASGMSSWFGKYETNGLEVPTSEKHYSYGMTEWYRRWLQIQPNATLASEPHESGDQKNQFSRYYFRPDPIDKKYGLPSDADYDGKYKQSDQHGMNRLPHSLSVTAHQTRDALEALERLAGGDKPFSLHLSLHSPHPPMIVTRKYYEMYSPDDLEAPISLDDDMKNSAYSRNDKLGNEYRNPSSLKRWLANYYGLITEIDDWVGVLLNKLDELGIAENTLLAFSSDHGEMLGAHAMRDKNTFYEESSHVPLLLWMPGTIPAGTIVDDPVSHLDLHSTFLDYLVGQTDYKTDGSNLRDSIEGNSGGSFVVTMRNYTEARFNYKPSSGPAFMIRKGQWKLMYAGQADNKNVDMLFHLGEDPAEMNNLIGLNGDTASDAVIGKAEHLKAMLVGYLRASEHPATRDVLVRRTWRDAKFWCGDFSIEFRADGTRTEYLYLGAPTGTPISLAILNDDLGRFGIRLESLDDLYKGSGVAVVAIRYFKNGLGDEMTAHSSAALSIIYGNATSYEEKRVELFPPTVDNAAGTTNVDSSEFKSKLEFILPSDLAEEGPGETEGTIATTEPKTPTQTSTPMPATIQCIGPSLNPTDKLYAGSFICSSNNRFRFGIVSDGDLSLWRGNTKIWSAETCCVGSETYALLQSRGNLVVYTYAEEDSEDDALTKTFLWASQTGQNPSSVLTIDDEGLVTIRAPDDEILWGIRYDNGLVTVTTDGTVPSANLIGLSDTVAQTGDDYSLPGPDSAARSSASTHVSRSLLFVHCVCYLCAYLFLSALSEEL